MGQKFQKSVNNRESHNKLLSLFTFYGTKKAIHIVRFAAIFNILIEDEKWIQRKRRKTKNEALG